MTSKQEKLAAARRKLKEFQGKNKGEISKQKSINDSLTSKISKENFESDSSVPYSYPLNGDKQSFKNNQPITHANYIIQPSWIKNEDSAKEKKISESSSNENNLSKLLSEHYNLNDYLIKDNLLKVQEEEGADFSNGLRVNCVESHFTDKKHTHDIDISKDNSVILSERSYDKKKNVFSPNDKIKVESMEAKEILNSEISNKSFNDVITSLQTELQSHIQTIKILVQERNEAQTALAEGQKLLTNKSEEAEELKKQMLHFTSSINNLSLNLFNAESVIMKLKLEKEETMQTLDEIKLLSDNFKLQLDTKEEELQELRQKYEEKNNNCQQLLFSLHEAQGQLSLNQIQLQQHSAEGLSDVASQISELQNENVSLKLKISELEKKLEMENAEKEESSQKFHIYAQQCNSQLHSLNSQLKSLQLENESLSQKNNILSKNLYELEKGSEREFSTQSFENEIADLHNQLSALIEENNQLQNRLTKKEEECTRLENELGEKDLETNNIFQKLKELEEENKKLANEAETPNVNERLLATIESDKIAASKAVSQNQKLKEQVVELEKVFMKLSEEKLELTNQLAYEKHMNNELQNILRDTKSKHIREDDHHRHHLECHHADEKSEPLINDSNEVEELRNIVRQLQDDKIELTARLNLYESNKSSFEKTYEKRVKGKYQFDHGQKHEEAQCENTKLLLQQMEEKVRKTMNEIAVLDEEKEKLEHLVLQLQGETETIGEYITLYQRQRMVLRQRAQEKDVQLQKLSKDKEELKFKLEALDELVQQLIAERQNITQQGPNLCTTSSSIYIPENTVGKIRALINEIGSTTIISSHSIAFEHCSCCSGRLITI